MKHHNVAKLVNALRDTAIKYKDHQCLRQKIHDMLGEYIDIKEDNDETVIIQDLKED